MVSAADTNNFYSLPLQQKFSFFETTIDEVVNSFDEKDLNKFLKGIILNVSENSHIRKIAIEIFTDCVFLDKLKIRYELTVLIDEWNNTDEVFLEIRRLKDLFFFYNNEPKNIEEIYQEKIENLESEIVAESYYHLGLIEMQKAFFNEIENDCISNLKKSFSFFRKSTEAIENRIDAEFFLIVTSIIIDLLEIKTGGIQQKLKSLTNILLQRDIFSISLQQNYFLISFYRKLANLIKIQTENISTWLDFRQGFNDLFYYYSEIKNLEVEKRLKQSILNTAFSQYIEKSFAQPYFAKNFPAKISQIDARLHETGLSSEQKEFLLYIKKLALDDNLKKKSDKEVIRKLLIKSLPNRNPQSIEEELKKISNSNDSLVFFEVFESLSKHSPERFRDSLVDACLKLQGNKIYRNVTEDERNDFIASLLDSSGYITKDQTRWGESYTGKSAGEIDIFVLEKDKTLFTIIEALNLDSLDSGVISLHIDKIFRYDTSGMKQNYILVYSTAKNFVGLWEKYVEFVKNHNYKYTFVDFEEITDYPFTDLKIGRVEHIRNDERIFLYHLMLNLNH